MPQNEEKEIPMSKSKRNSYSIKESPRITLNCRPREEQNRKDGGFQRKAFKEEEIN